MHFEGGSGVGSRWGGEILPEKIAGEVRDPAGFGEDAGGIDEGGAAEDVSGDSGAYGGEGLVGLVVASVEGSEVDPGCGVPPLPETGLRGLAELGFGGGLIAVRFGEEGEDAVALGLCGRLVEGVEHGGEAASLSGTTANDGWSGDIELAEIAGGGEIGGIETYGAFEGVTDLASEGEGKEGAGGAGFHALGAAEPELGLAAGGSVGGGCLALRDSRVGFLLRIERATEEKVSAGIGGMLGEPGTEKSGRVLDTALPQSEVGGRDLCAGGEREKEQKEERGEETERPEHFIRPTSPACRSRGPGCWLR